ncbi:MAG: HAD family hydrolase [Thermoguttaceae bacterium]
MVELFTGRQQAMKGQAGSGKDVPVDLQYQVLAVDVDGTLVSQEEVLTPATRDALIRAGEAGIHVILATGRRYSRTLHLVEPLGIEVPLVTASGALVKCPRTHKTFHCSLFPDEVLRKIVGVLDAEGYDPILCADTYGQGFDYYMARAEVDGVELAEYLRLNPDSGRLYPDLVRNPPSGVFNGFAMGSRERMCRLDRELHLQLEGNLSSHVLRSPRYTGYMCEFAPRGVTKWSAIRRLAADWNVPDEAICAVGDDVNDIPMIRGAGLGIAMGNAVPEVKAAADRVAPSQGEDGLVQVVEWLLGGAP